MKNLYIKIQGITCESCRKKIAKTLLSIDNVNQVKVEGNVAKVEYIDNIDKEEIILTIRKIGYETSMNKISDQKKQIHTMISLKEILIILGSFLGIYMVLYVIFDLNIVNLIPSIDMNVTYPMLFVIGLLTSFHCISMCGAINLYASTSIKRNLKKPVLYNLGRLLSYTLLGGLVGLLGSVFDFNSYIKGIVILITSLLMLMVSLNMAGFIHFQIPKIFKNRKRSVHNSFIIGVLNGFMPCGPLQAMQIYALSTGSFIYGALSMFLFCLGTIPLMLLVGILSNLFSLKIRTVFMKISIVLIFVLSLTMMNRGLLQMGIDVSSAFHKNYDNYIVAEIKDSYQYIEFDLSYGGYENIIVQKGIPVKLIVKADKGHITGCNNALEIISLQVKKELKAGENIIEFTPEKTGEFTYTCWMGMLKNSILVVEDIEKIK